MIIKLGEGTSLRRVTKYHDGSREELENIKLSEDVREDRKELADDLFSRDPQYLDGFPYHKIYGKGYIFYIAVTNSDFVSLQGNYGAVYECSVILGPRIGKITVKVEEYPQGVVPSDRVREVVVSRNGYVHSAISSIKRFIRSYDLIVRSDWEEVLVSCYNKLEKSLESNT